MGKLFGCGGNFSVQPFSAVLMATVQIPGGDAIISFPVLFMQVCPSAISTASCIRSSVIMSW